jgi:acyl-coenzyme A synthetase/AMP-(fatty) acid ligase
MDVIWENITDPVFHYARERPQAPAFHEGHVTLSYAALALLVGKAAVHLDRLGIRAGDRVAISLTNSIDHFILTLGLLRLGATTVEIPYDSRGAPPAELLGQFAIGRIFLEAGTAPVIGVASVSVDAGWRGEIEQASGDRRYAGSGDDIFTISLTSGTTGAPKGSLASHRQYFQRMLTSTEPFAPSGVFSVERPAAFLLTSSVGFTAFFRRMVSHLFIGGPVVILPELMHVIDLVKAIGAWGDALCFVPSALCRVLIGCAPSRGLLFPRLRALVAGGGFLYAEEKLAVLARVTPHFYECYGASGFGTLSVLPPDAMADRAASVGRPPSSVEVQVVGRDGNPLPTGAIGRLRCRGTEGKGFAGETDPEADERFRDGWYYPGDFAALDAAGFIFLKGRAADVIYRNGVELFAPDIEEVLVVHPSVAEVAIVGVPRPVRGDEMIAIVVPCGPAQHEALAQYCRARLPVERWPDRVFYAQALPRTASGKLDRAQVKELAMMEIGRQNAGRGAAAAG